MDKAPSHMFTFIALVVTKLSQNCLNLVRMQESPQPKHGNRCCQAQWFAQSPTCGMTQAGDALVLEGKSLRVQVQCSVLETVRWWSGVRSWGGSRWREGALGKVVWRFTLICSGRAGTGIPIHLGGYGNWGLEKCNNLFEVTQLRRWCWYSTQICLTFMAWPSAPLHIVVAKATYLLFLIVSSPSDNLEVH